MSEKCFSCGQPLYEDETRGYHSGSDVCITLLRAQLTAAEARIAKLERVRDKAQELVDDTHEEDRANTCGIFNMTFEELCAALAECADE